MKNIAILKTIALMLSLSSATAVHAMAPDDAAEQNLKRHVDDDGQQPEKRQRVVNEEQEAIECSICQAEIEESEARAKLSCRHQFHQECVDEWFSRQDRQLVQRKCPLCRAAQAPFLLHQAVADDNFQQFSAVIETGADLNSFNNEDLTPLQIAIMRGNEALVRELLIRGAHPNLFNRENPESQTPLELAIRSENFIILRYLADRVDVNKAISLDWRPLLHQAIASPHMTLILLQAGANPNARDANEATPLHVASYFGNRQTINLLIAYRANLTLQDYDGRTPLQTALLSKQNVGIEVIMDLVRAGSKVNQRDRLGRTAIFHAAEKSNTEAVRHLIESGANVNLKDRYYFTPLTFAIHTKNIEVVRMLLAAGAHITRSPIMTAALHYNKEIFELILAAPQMTIESGEMALSDKQVAEPVKTLIREFIIAKSGFSPAAAASAAESCESKAVTQTAPCSLVSAAAPATAPEEEQPIEILAPVVAAAARPVRHYRATRQCLRELRIAITQRRPEAIEILRHLAASGFGVNIRGLHGETLLHLAAQHENIEAVHFLLAQPGIDLHARDNLNNTIIEVTRSEEIRAIIQEATEEQEQ